MATKAQLKSEQNEITKLQTFDSSYFRDKNHFDGGEDMQNDLLFQPVYKYFKKITNSNHILGWKSKGLCDESIKPPAASNDIQR